MKEYRVGLGVVCICSLLLSWGAVASAQDDAFSAAEKRALSGFEMEEERTSLPKFTTQFGVQLTEAKVRYERNFQTENNKSRWDGWMSRGDLTAAVYHENNMGIEIGLGVFTTTTDEEKWDSHENNTNFDGWELKLGLGWLRDFEGTWKVKQVLSYGHRIMEFDLRGFKGTPDGSQYIDSPGTQITENITLDYFEYSPHFTAEVREKWSFSFKPGLAYVLFSEASYSHSKPVYDGAKIKGEWGFIASVDALLNYQFTEGSVGYIGAVGEWQYLEGDTSGEMEWPDNDLFTYGLKVGLTFGL